MLQPNPRKRPYSARAISITLAEIKKLDATQAAAVDQMTASFNPLNAGADKTEARRILGKKVKARSEPAVSFFQSIPFMVTSLILILGLVIFMALPPSTSKQMHKAAELLKSGNAANWNEARMILKPILEGNSKYAAQAEQMYLESRRKSLVYQAERGNSNRLQSENVRLFGKAVRLQQDGRIEEANGIFQELVDSIDSEAEDHFIRDEAQLRINRMQQAPPLPKNPRELMMMINRASLAEGFAELQSAHKTLSRIMLEFAGEEGYQPVIQATMNQLPVIKAKLTQATAERDLEQDDSGKDAPDATTNEKDL